MRPVILGLAAFSLVACATEPAPAAATDDSQPQLHMTTADGGRVSNANAEHAAKAVGFASDYCSKSGRDMRVTGITLERNALIFTCVPA